MAVISNSDVATEVVKSFILLVGRVGGIIGLN